MVDMAACECLRLRYADQYEAFARLWTPGGTARGAVLYLHGIQSHGGWFEGSAGRLAEAGFTVLLPDRRGSGRNDVDRGHAPSVRQVLRDAAEALDELHVRTGRERLHVVGVSWGGKLAMALRGFAAERIASLTLVGPGLFPRVDLPMGEKARVGLSALARKRATFGIPLNEAELFTGNAARQAFIRDDPLRLMRATAGFLLASRRLDRLAMRSAGDGRGCPLRVFLAGRDRIIDNGRTRDFVRRLTWPEREIIEYPDAEHTLEFEAEPEPYFRDLVEWVTTAAARGRS